MTLSFDRVFASYDAEQDMVRFRAHDDGRFVPCAVTRAALLHGLDVKISDTGQMIDLYRDRIAEITRVAEKLYRARRWEENGTVIVGNDELNSVRG